MSFQPAPRCGNQNKIEVVKDVKIGANVVVDAGKVYVFVGGYLVAPATANAATGKRPVVAMDSVDNTGGADGAKTVDVMYDFWYDMANDGTHPVAQTDVMTSLVYLSSPTTISVNSADGPLLNPRPAVVSFGSGPLSARPVRVEIR